MPTIQEIKDQINADIRDKTAPGSVTRANVADSLDAALDFTQQQVASMYGVVSVVVFISFNFAGTGSWTVLYSDNTIDLTITSFGPFGLQFWFGDTVGRVIGWHQLTVDGGSRTQFVLAADDWPDNLVGIANGSLEGWVFLTRIPA